MGNDFIETFFTYQQFGAHFLSSRRFALLADEMGLGKSAQSILASDFTNSKRVCIICPAIARVNWIREFEKFSTNKRVFQIIEKKNERINEKASIIISYDLASSYAPDSFCGNFDLLILDEVHYLKSIKTKRTLNILGKNGYAHKAKRTWALSGTPCPNHAGELWPWLYTTGQTKLSYLKFIEKFCIQKNTIKYGNQIIGTKMSEVPALKDILKPNTLRRTAKEVLKDLPSINFQYLYVEPGNVKMDMVQSWVQHFWPHDYSKDLFDQLAKEQKVLEETIGLTGLNPDGMKVLEGMASSVSTLRRYIGLQKVQPTIDLVTEELNEGQINKVVLFALHTEVISQLRDGLKQFNPVIVRGGMPNDKRQSNIDKFQTNPRCKVFIGQILACGTAINLNAANQLIFVEQDWVPGNNFQAAKRCHRIGQTRPVFVRCLAVPDSIDERISLVLRRKMAELQEIFEKELNDTAKPR